MLLSTATPPRRARADPPVHGRDTRLRFEHGILAVIDGSKALRTAVAKVFGAKALIQRCTLHKRRNVIGYLPVARRKAIDRGSPGSSPTPTPKPVCVTHAASPHS